MFHMDVRTNSNTLSLQPQLTCFITEKEFVYCDLLNVFPVNLLLQGWAMFQTVSLRPLAAEAGVKSQVTTSEFCGGQTSTSTCFLSVNFGFLLSVSFQQCPTPIFICDLFLPEGQNGEGWELSKTWHSFVIRGALNRKLRPFLSSPNYLCFWTRGDDTVVCDYDCGTYITFGIIRLLYFAQHPKFKIKIKHDIAGAGFIPLLKQGARYTPTQVVPISGVSFILLLDNGHQSCSGNFVNFVLKAVKWTKPREWVIRNHGGILDFVTFNLLVPEFYI